MILNPMQGQAGYGMGMSQPNGMAQMPPQGGMGAPMQMPSGPTQQMLPGMPQGADGMSMSRQPMQLGHPNNATINFAQGPQGNAIPRAPTPITPGSYNPQLARQQMMANMLRR